MNCRDAKRWVAAGAVALSLTWSATAAEKSMKDMTGTISADGSSTVEPITSAVAEEFRAEAPQVKATVGTSGTGGGFKKFVLGETDISDASRPIKAAEIEACVKGGIEFIELPIAFDGLSVLVNPKNTFVDHLTVEELNSIWKPESTIKNWNQVRAGFPDKPLKLYGPGTDSGTFEYFTEAINGKAKACRADFTASEDDNVLVQGIAGDEGSLGYFGLAYYMENKDKLKLVPIKKGDAAPVSPSEETVKNGTYQPLSRPLFIYPNKKSAARPEVKAFVEFYLAKAPELVKEVGYIALPEKAYDMARKRFAEMKTGSVFSSAPVGLKIEEVLAKEESAEKKEAAPAEKPAR